MSKRIWVMCGGVSAEHEISVLSGRNVAAGFRQTDYAVEVIYVTRQGQWYQLNSVDAFLDNAPETLVTQGLAQALLCIPGEAQPLRTRAAPEAPLDCYCVFSVLHGTGGEDGVMQGFLETARLPMVGCGVLASAVCMTKSITKVLLEAAGIATAPWVSLTFDHHHETDFAAVSQRLGPVLFVKPAAQGSSVGISKVSSAHEYNVALQEAFVYDNTVVVEKAINGREIECSVLGNDIVEVALPGEIISHGQFYSFDAKYVDESSASVVTPAALSDAEIEAIQPLAKRVYRVLGCCGLARVDLFLQHDGSLVVNEVNTLPGFTNISMYPKNWQATGLLENELLQRLVELAHENFKARQQKLLCSQHSDHTLNRPMQPSQG